MIEKFMIENESEADEYLNNLFLKKEFRSMDVVEMRAIEYISDKQLRYYFINKAKEVLMLN